MRAALGKPPKYSKASIMQRIIVCVSQLTSTHNSRRPPNVVEGRDPAIQGGGRKMEWKPTWNDPLTSYVAPYHDLIGDKRTRTTFDETIRGIMGAGSLICQQIAALHRSWRKGRKGPNASFAWRVERVRCARPGCGAVDQEVTTRPPSST